MAADERVHKKAHFGPVSVSIAAPSHEPETEPKTPGSNLTTSNGIHGIEQAQALTFESPKELAHRRDIYSIHGEQVCTLTIRHLNLC